MYAPPQDYTDQLMQMLSQRPQPVQPVGFNVPSMTQIDMGGGREDPMNLGAAGDSFDLASAAMDWLGSSPLGSQPVVSGTPGDAFAAMQKMPASQAFNAPQPQGTTLTNAQMPSMSPDALMSMIGKKPSFLSMFGL